MKPGRLRHRIIIQQLTRTPDGGGGYTEDWTTFASVWADVYPLKGTERYEAQKVQASISHRITARYRAGVKPSMRVNYNGRIFGIDAVIDVEERHHVLQLLCSEVTPA